MYVPPAKSDAGTPSIARRTFASLANPQYRLLWVGLLLLMGGTSIQMLARSFLAWELTHSNIQVAVAGLGFAPPILLFSLFGGTIADRLERRRIIQAGQLGSTLIALFVAFSIITDTVSIGHLIAASFMQGTFFAFLMPARQTIIPQLVKEHEVTNAIALNASGMSLTTLAGPVAGGFIYAAGGPEAAYFTVAGMSFAALLLTSRLKVSRPPGANKSKRMWRDVLEGLRYTRSNRTVLMLLLLALGTTMLAMPFRSLLPAQIELVFLKDVRALGLLTGMIGLGALFGSLAIAGLTVSQHRGRVLLFSTAISGVAIILAGLNTTYWLAAVIMVLVGVGDAGRRALNASLIMELTDVEHRGRVMGVYMMNFGLIPVGLIPLALLSDEFGVRFSFTLAGALLLAVAAVATLATSRIRRL